MFLPADVGNLVVKKVETVLIPLRRMYIAGEAL